MTAREYRAFNGAEMAIAQTPSDLTLARKGAGRWIESFLSFSFFFFGPHPKVSGRTLENHLSSPRPRC